MADKTTGMLQEAEIGQLPALADIYDDALIPVEFQGAARHINGRQWKRYAQAGVSPSIDSAEQSAKKAAASAAEAKDSASESKGHAAQALAQRQAIENMTVSAESVPSDKPATAKKTSAGGSFHISFEIPMGVQGATGPRGPQGVQGPQGPRGIDGVAVSADGLYAFNVNADGHLILSYTGGTAPNFSIGDDGHLYLNIL